MPHIVLSNEQAAVILHSRDTIEARDETGRTLAHIVPLSAEDIEAIEQSKQARSIGAPRVPSEQVQAHFRRLDEIRMHEELTEERTLQILKRLRAGNNV